jgi:hypothetical protein
LIDCTVSHDKPVSAPLNSAGDSQQVRDVLSAHLKIPKAAGVALGFNPAKLDQTELRRVADPTRAFKCLRRHRLP